MQGCTGKLSRSAAVGLCAAALAACGGSPAAGPSSSAPSSSAPSSSASRATRAAAAPTTSATELAARVNAATRATKTVTLTMSTQSNGQASSVEATGALRVRPDGSDLAMDMTAAGRKLSMVFQGGTFYLDVGQPVAGKKWLKISPAGTDPLSKAFAPMLRMVGSNSSVQSQLAALTGAKIVSAVPTTVDGAPATTYTVALSEKNLLASVGALKYPAQLRKSLAALFKGATGRTVLTVDAHDLVRRIVSTVTSSMEHATTTITYTGWGKPVTIKAPTASDVADPSALVP
jgi:hypothetical protein